MNKTEIAYCCTTSVVDILNRHFEDRCDKMIKKTDYVPYQVGAKIHPFISILNIDPYLYLPKGSFYLFILSVFHIMQPFQHGKVQNIQDQTFFVNEICNLQRIYHGYYN